VLSDRYRFERELGAGGMATVYLARDLKHDRRVALKVLHPELGAVLGIERFLSEIKTTANLQHPNILQLFDSGSADGLVYYTMPFVEGESLRSRLERETVLPVADAVAIARGVAAALDYAHRHGVIHRDIKPENILLHEGQALVADFGIALAVKQAGGARLTQTGLSLGTPQYMSPEQATGERELDARSDVYSLGAVTYEMLAGEAPFTAPTTQAVIARLMTDEPRALSSIRKTVSPAVEAAVHRALEKLPADRFATAAQFAEALTGSATGTISSLRRSSAVRIRRQSWLPLTIMAGITLASLLGAAWALLQPERYRPRPVLRYSLTPPAHAMILDVAVTAPLALTPDGSKLIYVGPPRGLYLWNLDQATPTFVAGTEVATAPFVSPDGEWIGFLVGGQVRKKSLRSGEVVTVGDILSGTGSLRGATWTAKDVIVVATSAGLVSMPAAGGTVRRIPIDSLSLMVRFPEALPDGEWIVASVANRQGPDPPELAAIAIADGRLVRLGVKGSNPKYVDQGYLVYSTVQGGLHAVPFDARNRRITGTSKQISGSVSTGALGGADLAVARSGTIVYLEGASSPERRLIRVERSGKEQQLEAPVRSYTGPRISPDGSRIAVTLGDAPNPPNDIWLYDLTLGTLGRLTSDSTSMHPEWSADGRRVYHRQARSSFLAMVTTPDRSAPAESLYAGVGDLIEVVPSRSGDTLITRELRSAEDDRDLFLVPLKPAGPVVKFAGGPGLQVEPALSPDGRWLAYTSEESGNREVYVRPFPGPGPRYQVSSQGGQAPRWNPAGGELFFNSRDTLMAVPARTEGNALVLGRSRPLFPLHYATLPFHANYDVAPEGTWFVFVADQGDPTTRSIRMVVNWFDHFPGEN
jgi:serine/threonine-protein kinase